ncbi:MAG: orotidine-5'-phosphate decarboxylase [Candidatus Omnitrophica bacterium]|nr:orotidine-5'-phosphate decarboxylase [Candidatus Omnitrophota bacterium]
MPPVTSHQSPQLIVALDVDTLEKATHFVDILYPTVKLFKVGSSLFPAWGTDVVRMVGKKGGRVFLDLKFLDIPNTVYSATASGTSSCIAVYSIPSGLDEKKTEDQVTKHLSSPVFMMTLHTLGSSEMLRKGVKGAEDEAAKQGIKKPLLVGVTVLTCEVADVEEVLKRACIAKEAGLDGVVCSAHEAAAVKEACGKDFLVVAPGIRPKGYKTDDQKRKATAQEAIAAGADFIVVGRPILEAQDPRKAAEDILKELS